MEQTLAMSPLCSWLRSLKQILRSYNGRSLAGAHRRPCTEAKRRQARASLRRRRSILLSVPANAWDSWQDRYVKSWQARQAK